MRGLTLSLFAAAAMVGSTTFSLAQPQQAGVSAAVRGQVALARASANIVGRQVQSGDPIFLGDAITSGSSSGMQIMLMDETVFSIGPNSEISIDEFVYDPSSETGKVTASVAKGVFRFITGKIAQKRPEDMTVRLPTATIGIRGTIVAGAVRSSAGEDPAVDKVFEGLGSIGPDAKNARDFVVLLGPGDENNTNDRGGAFVFTSNAPERAESGLSAGAPALGGTGGGLASTEVRRQGFGAYSSGGNQISDAVRIPSDATQGLTGGLDAQPPTGAKGSPSDDNAQEANNTSASDADSLSGNTIADAAAGGEQATQLADTGDKGNEITDPTAGSGANAFDFDDLRAIASGIGSFSGGLAGVASSVLFNVNFGNQTFQFHLNGILSTGAELGCFSTCSVDYSGRPGAAFFTEADADPGVVSTHCTNCTAVMQFTSSDTLNVSVEHQGETGTNSVTLNISQ